LHVPLSNPCSGSKRWWTDELAILRQEMARMHRKWKSDRHDSHYTDYKRSRNLYFQAIRQSKAQCWKTFLNSAHGQDIFTAAKYTRPTMSLKTPTLSGLRCRYNHSERKNHTKFFAEPPPHWSKTIPHRLNPSLHQLLKTKHPLLF